MEASLPVSRTESLSTHCTYHTGQASGEHFADQAIEFLLPTWVFSTFEATEAQSPLCFFLSYCSSSSRGWRKPFSTSAEKKSFERVSPKAKEEDLSSAQAISMGSPFLKSAIWQQLGFKRQAQVLLSILKGLFSRHTTKKRFRVKNPSWTAMPSCRARLRVFILRISQWGSNVP